MPSIGIIERKFDRIESHEKKVSQGFKKRYADLSDQRPDKWAFLLANAPAGKTALQCAVKSLGRQQPHIPGPSTQSPRSAPATARQATIDAMSSTASSLHLLSPREDDASTSVSQRPLAASERIVSARQRKQVLHDVLRTSRSRPFTAGPFSRQSSQGGQKLNLLAPEAQEVTSSCWSRKTEERVPDVAMHSDFRSANLAAEENDFAKCMRYIQSDQTGAQLNWAPAKSGRSCLHHAAIAGREDVVSWLLLQNAQDSQLPSSDKDFPGMTAQMIIQARTGANAAAKAGHFGVMQEMLATEKQRQLAINWRPMEGYHAGRACLHHAALAGRDDICIWLQSHGASDCITFAEDPDFPCKTPSYILEHLTGHRLLKKVSKLGRVAGKIALMGGPKKPDIEDSSDDEVHDTGDQGSGGAKRRGRMRTCCPLRISRLSQRLDLYCNPEQVRHEANVNGFGRLSSKDIAEAKDRGLKLLGKE